MTKASALTFLKLFTKKKVAGPLTLDECNVRSFVGARMAIMKVAHEIEERGVDECNLLAIIEMYMEEYEILISRACEQSMDIFDGAWHCLSEMKYCFLAKERSGLC